MGTISDHNAAGRTQNADIRFADQSAQRNSHQVACKRSRGESLMAAIYIESSAILAWLLGEQQAGMVISTINQAETAVTSVLSIIEVERALNRAECSQVITAGQIQAARGMMERAKAGWILMEISEEVRIRAGRQFPIEPVRTLDAIHLSTALIFMRVFPDLKLLSLDNRILQNAQPLGIALL
jgi:predicted nucleic acid-binding protein